MAQGRKRKKYIITENLWQNSLAFRLIKKYKKIKEKQAFFANEMLRII